MSVTLQSLHILGACLFIGNIIVSAFWKVAADRTNNYSVICFATRLVNVTDMVFTGVGATLLLVTGHLLAQNYGGIVANGWTMWSYALFGISGPIWMVVLVPIQFKQARVLRLAPNQEYPHEYHRLSRLWWLAGTLATLFPLPPHLSDGFQSGITSPSVSVFQGAIISRPLRLSSRSAHDRIIADTRGTPVCRCYWL